MNIHKENIDLISEKYRKYILRIIINKKNYYCVWCTNIRSKNEEDYFLLDDKKQILTFFDLNGFKKINKSNDMFFHNSLYTWKKNVTNEIKQSQMDLSKMIERTNSIDYIVKQLKNISKVNTLQKKVNLYRELFDIYNLIQDYAYQINNKKLIAFLKARIFKDAMDYLFIIYFAKKYEFYRNYYKNKKVKIDSKKLKIHYFKLIELFKTECLGINSLEIKRNNN